jgi:uncharacterized protein (TIRG00374 family)
MYNTVENACMTAATKPSFSKKIYLFIGFGLLTLVFYLYYFVGTMNIADIVKRANFLVYASAFIAFVASVFFASLTWQSLLGNLAVKVKMRRVFLLMWFGLFFDATVPEPGWSGDLSKAYMLAKTSGEDAGRIVASVVSQKIIGMVITVVDLVIGLVLLALNYLVSGLVLIFIAAVLFLSIFSLAIVWYLSSKPKATGRILSWIISVVTLLRRVTFLRRGHWDAEEFQRGAEEFLKDFHEGINTLSARPKTLVRPVLYSLSSWGFDVSVVFLTFASLGYPIPVDKVLIIYALTGSLQIIGVSLVGFTEVIMSGAYTILGVPAALSLSVTLLTRIVTLWFKLIVSYVAFQWAGVEVLTGRKLGRKKAGK